MLIVVEVVVLVEWTTTEAGAAPTAVVESLEVVLTVLEANSNIRTCRSISNRGTFRPCVKNKGEDVALKPLLVKQRMELQKSSRNNLEQSGQDGGFLFWHTREVCKFGPSYWLV